MATIRCRSCGRIYDYNKQDMCPKCGAYNRPLDRKSTRLNSSHSGQYRMPSSA